MDESSKTATRVCCRHRSAARNLINRCILVCLRAVPPRFTKRPQDREASEHQDLEFECEIYGKPPPVITWLKNGERIKLSNYWQLINGFVFSYFHSSAVGSRAELYDTIQYASS